MEASLISLAPAIQLQIINLLDPSSLAGLARTNSHLTSTATHALWSNLDFASLEFRTSDGDEIIAIQRRFFVTCAHLIETQPERWCELAQNVRVLRLSRILGIAVATSGLMLDDERAQWIEIWHAAISNVFEVMAHFTRLEELYLFDKGTIDRDWRMNVRQLTIGGSMLPEGMDVWLSTPENIEELALITLQKADAPQTSPSGNLPIPAPSQHCFNRLRSLHFCSMSALSRNHIVVVDLPWPREYETDEAVPTG